MAEEDKVPKGFKTVKEWSKEFKREQSQTRIYLKRGLERGKLKTETYRIKTGRGVYPVPHYASNQG